MIFTTILTLAAAANAMAVPRPFIAPDINVHHANETLVHVQPRSEHLQRRCVVGYNCQDACSGCFFKVLFACTFQCGGHADTPACTEPGLERPSGSEPQ